MADWLLLLFLLINTPLGLAYLCDYYSVPKEGVSLMNGSIILLCHQVWFIWLIFGTNHDKNQEVLTHETGK